MASTARRFRGLDPVLFANVVKKPVYSRDQPEIVENGRAYIENHRLHYVYYLPRQTENVVPLLIILFPVNRLPQRFQLEIERGEDSADSVVQLPGYAPSLLFLG